MGRGINEASMSSCDWGLGLGEMKLKVIAFKYLTPKMRLDHDSLPKRFVRAESFHLICSAERCLKLVAGISGRWERSDGLPEFMAGRPSFVWEPVPDICIPSEVDNFQKAIREVDIVSPNLEELLAMFPHRTKLEAVAEVLGWGIGPDSRGVLVIREGKDGCSAFCGEQSIHLRAFHLADRPAPSKVVDPTGAGNAFTGALALALQREDLLRRVTSRLGCGFGDLSILIAALVYATVAASFVIEQYGTPVYEGNEMWNGESLEKRVDAYMAREKTYLVEQLSGD